MIVFNWTGLLFIVVGMAIGYGVQGAVGPIDQGNTLAVSVGCIAAALIDLVYRWRANVWEGASRFIKPSTGGQLMFLPLWAVASVGLVYGILEASGAVGS